MTLTPKEKSLLKDLKSQEKLCIEKYTKSASEAVDPQLKNLFNQIAKGEQAHLNIIEKMEQGSVSQPKTGKNQGQTTFSSTYGKKTSADKKNDCFLCNDVLAAEKHASNLYDTCIFEFNDEKARNALNQIQKQEQNHGKLIYDYMSTNNMYA